MPIMKNPRQCSSPITVPDSVGTFDAASTFEEDILRRTVEKPIAARPDPVLLARSTGSSFKRVGSIGVASPGKGGNFFSSPKNNKDRYALRSPSAAPKILKKQSSYTSKNTDDSSLESIAVFTFDEADGVANNNTAVSAIKSPKSVRWSKGVKSAATAGCNPGASFISMKSLIADMSAMTTKGFKKLDRKAQQLRGGLEGLGMTCNGGGGANNLSTMMMCSACNNACDSSEIGCRGGCTKLRCGAGSNVDNSSSFMEEENDLVFKEKRDDENTDTNKPGNALGMREGLKDMRNEMRDGLKDMRTDVESARGALNECREAMIQPNNVYQAMASVNSSRFAEKPGDKIMYARQQQYAHSTSLRESAYNIETGMGNGELVMSNEDPFSSSMHANQRSPRASAGRPRSILRKSSSKSPTITSPRSPRVPTSGSNNVMRTSKTLLGRRNKDKRFATKNATSRTSNDMNRDKRVLQERTTQKKKKKKSIGRLVIGGLKKPMKLASQGVKAKMKNVRGPLRIMAVAASPGVTSPRAQHRGYDY